MVREVKYYVIEDLINPETIYAGTINKDKIGKGYGTWKTRGEVTEQVKGAFFRHMIARTKKDNPKGKGVKYTFDNVYGYTVEVSLKPIEKKVKNE